MKYYKVTQFNPGPPIDLDDTNIVYLEAENGGELLLVSMRTHNKPVKTYEEVSKSVYDENV